MTIWLSHGVLTPQNAFNKIFILRAYGVAGILVRARARTRTSKTRAGDSEAVQREPQLAYWHIGILAYWRIGILAYWHTGILAYWHIGILAYWHTGILRCWQETKTPMYKSARARLTSITLPFWAIPSKLHAFFRTFIVRVSRVGQITG